MIEYRDLFIIFQSGVGISSENEEFFLCVWVGGSSGLCRKHEGKSRYSWCFKNTPEFYDSLDCCQLYMYGLSSCSFVGLAYVFSNSF